jgi:methylthioribose-1-phosphate isomerase
MSNLNIIGWGPFPLPGERKRHERAEAEARAHTKLVMEALEATRKEPVNLTEAIDEAEAYRDKGPSVSRKAVGMLLERIGELERDRDLLSELILKIDSSK